MSSQKRKVIKPHKLSRKWRITDKIFKQLLTITNTLSPV